jgi:hypothetical protein
MALLRNDLIGWQNRKSICVTAIMIDGASSKWFDWLTKQKVHMCDCHLTYSYCWVGGIMFSEGFPRPPQTTFRTITQERVAWLISYFFDIAGWDRRGALSILVVIRFPIWPPGGHLGFSILLHNLRSTWSINFIFYGCNGMDQWRCPIDFGRDLLSNMAARWLSWILHSFTFRSITWEPLTQLI